MPPVDGLRYDFLHETWVIIAPGREKRPSDQRLQVVTDPSLACPFCPGAESETPPEILATGRLDAAGGGGLPWRVRIFANRYPAIAESEGRHEVVVITPDHASELADLEPEAIAEMLQAVQARTRVLASDPAVAAVLFFLNSGAGAGASLAHAHGQLLATRVVPSLLRSELAACAAWRREHGTCLLCDLAARAKDQGRLVAAEREAIVVAPFASRFAWETLILPRRHAPRFEDAPPSVLAAMAQLLGEICLALRAVLEQPAYNLVLHTPPPTVEDFHWHLELLPRLAPLAGFETGTGFFINPVCPEAAAATLRNAMRRQANGAVRDQAREDLA